MDTIPFDSLCNTTSDRVIFRGIWGSHAYGTSTPESDRDTIGVFIVEQSHYLSIGEPVTQIADEGNDNRFYALKNYLELASNANPNILDSLFLPKDCVLESTPYWQRIQAQRRIFVSRKASKTYCEYAMSQIKKARGCNKRVHNPHPEEPPTEDGFCRVLLPNTSGMPGRPLMLKDAGINLKHCHVSAVENASELYRLYDYGQNAKGVFRNGMLVCESIPKDDEKTHFIGLLLFNKNAFEKAKSDHRQYWEWRKHRNDARWRSQESGEMDYDAKNLMHTFRLLYSGLNVMECGEPLVRFSGEKLQELMAIRAGKYTYDELLSKAKMLSDKLESLRDKSELPESADMNTVNRLLLEVTAMWEADHAR